MLEFTSKTSGTIQCSHRVTLPWEKRIKSRLRITLDNGADAGVFLPRGTILRGGDILLSKDSTAVKVVAAPEKVSTVTTSDPLLLCRICYHLGNRHVALEIGENRASYLHDHVLDEMVTHLGGQISCAEQPFEPEHGAYQSHSHATGHGHSHG